MKTRKQEQPSTKTGIMIVVLTIALFASALSYNTEDKITGSIVKVTGMVTGDYTKQYNRLSGDKNIMTTFRLYEDRWYYFQKGMGDYMSLPDQNTPKNDLKAMSEWDQGTKWTSEKKYDFRRSTIPGVLIYPFQGPIKEVYNSDGLQLSINSQGNINGYLDDNGEYTKSASAAHRSYNVDSMREDRKKGELSPYPTFILSGVDENNPTGYNIGETPSNDLVNLWKVEDSTYEPPQTPEQPPNGDIDKQPSNSPTKILNFEHIIGDNANINDAPETLYLNIGSDSPVKLHLTKDGKQKGQYYQMVNNERRYFPLNEIHAGNTIQTGETYLTYKVAEGDGGATTINLQTFNKDLPYEYTMVQYPENDPRNGQIDIIQTQEGKIKKDGRKITIINLPEDILTSNRWKGDDEQLDTGWDSLINAFLHDNVQELNNNDYKDGIWTIGKQHYRVYPGNADTNTDGYTLKYSSSAKTYTRYTSDGRRIVFRGTKIIDPETGVIKLSPKGEVTEIGYDHNNNMISMANNAEDGTRITTKWVPGEYNSRIITMTNSRGTVLIKLVESPTDPGVFESNGKHYNKWGNEIKEDEKGIWKKTGKENKMAKKAIEESNNQQGTRAGFWISLVGDLENLIDITSGYSFFRWLYDESDIIEYDERIINLLSGTEGLAAEACKGPVLDDGYGLEDGWAFSLSVAGASAHIEGEKIPIMNYTDPNQKQFYYYKISFEVNPGSRVTGCDLNFETYLKDNGNYIPLMMEDSGSVYTWDLKRGEGSVSYKGSNMRIIPSKKEYTKACIKFNSIIPRTGRTCLIGINEGDYLCNKITLGAEQEFNPKLHGPGRHVAWFFGLGGEGEEGTTSTTGTGTTSDQEEAKVNPKI
ncbi:hypothetical protein CEE44_04160 [Candidatus Woesearchaeota archaeon B3_Woes]|nr:MAG: hypothetical protein CEE44_04160 [Candidatus Woesearchaeota archaeon B3_Woes]